MSESSTLLTILERVATGTHTDADLEVLRRALSLGSEKDLVQLGKYNVNITQGQDVRIGDTIYQGPSAEAIQQVIRQVLEDELPRVKSALRIRVPFQAPPLPTHFVPRSQVSRQIKSQLLASNPDVSGVLVVSAIHGLGGIGKTTLAAALAYDSEVQARFPDGILWATLGHQADILPLLHGWIQALGDYQFHPMNIDVASSHLRTLLHDKAALLIVDDAWNPIHTKAFLNGGPNCRVIITTREALIAKSVNATLYNLDVLTPEQALALLCLRLGRDLTNDERSHGLDLAEMVGYLPLALELAAAQVADGIPWTELLEDLHSRVGRLEALELPGIDEITDEGAYQRFGLRASLSLSLQSLSQTQLIAFAWFGVLPDDVSVSPMIAATLWNCDLRNARDTLRVMRDKALLLPGVSQPDGTQTYRLHDLIHHISRHLLTNSLIPMKPNILQGLGLTWAQAHQTLLERYRSQVQNGLWHTLPDDGYIHAHLTWHLEQAGRDDEVYALLREETPEGRNGWYETRERLGQGVGYLNDVNRAWELTKSDNDHHASAATVGMECFYALILTTINSLAKNIPTELLIALVEKTVWTPIQGLAYARRVPDSLQRAQSLTKIALHLKDPLRKDALSEALDTVQELRSSADQALALMGLVSHLPQNMLGRAFSVAMEIQSSDDQANVIAVFALRLIEMGRPEEILTGAQKIRSTRNLSKLLIALARQASENERLRIAHEAISTIHLVQSPIDRLKLFVDIIPLLPEPERTEIFEKDFRNTLKLLDFNGQEQLLIWIVSGLPEPERNKILQEILSIAYKIETASHQVGVLFNILKFLDEVKRPQVLRDALMAFRAINANTELVKVIRDISSHLPDFVQLQLIQEVLTAARAIRDPYEQAIVFIHLIQILPEHEKRQLLSETITLAHTINSDGKRLRVLTELISYMPVSKRDKIANEIILEAQRLPSWEDWSWAVSKSFPYLSQEMLTQMLRLVEKLEQEWNRRKALKELSPFLSQTLLQEGLKIARIQQDDVNRQRVILYLAPYLPQRQLRYVLTMIQRSLRSTFLFSDRPEYKDDILHMLTNTAGRLPRELLPEALTIARSLGTENQLRALIALIPHLPLELLQSVLAKDSNFSLHFSTKNSEILIASIFRLIELGAIQQAMKLLQELRLQDEKLLLKPVLQMNQMGYRQEALEMIRSIKDYWMQTQILIELAPHFQDMLLHNTLIITKKSPQTMSEWHAFTKLIIYVRKERRARVIQESIAKARKISDTFNQLDVLTRLAIYLPEAERVQILREVLALIPKIQGIYFRERAIEILAPQLNATLLLEATDIIEATLTTEEQLRAILILIPYLPYEDRIYSANKYLLEARISNRLDISIKLTQYLTQPERIQIMKEILAVIGNIRSIYDCTTQLVDLQPYVIEEIHEGFLKILRDTIILVCRIDDMFNREDYLKRSMPILTSLRHNDLMQLWNVILPVLSNRTRRHLLADIKVLVPVINKIGNEESFYNIFQAIQDLGKWFS